MPRAQEQSTHCCEDRLGEDPRVCRSGLLRGGDGVSVSRVFLETHAARLMGTLDRSGDGSVGMNEFLQGMTKLAKKAIEVPPAAATAETFDGFDGLDI